MKNGYTLNKEQLSAVTHDKGPLLIIAGAGTGKTTVVTERIKHLIIEKKVLPSQILALTFTEKAAREMEERVDVAMPYGYTQMWISTFHAFCDRVLRNDAAHIGLSPAYRLLTQAETVLFLRQNIFTFRLSYFRPLGNPNKFLEGLIQHFSRLADEDISPSQYLKYAQGISNVKSQISNEKNKGLNAKRYLLDAERDEIKKNLELAEAYKIYTTLKAKEGVMDYSDLITNTLELFRERKNILRTYQEQFEYVLVDEFQDTNFAQNQLAILLSGKKKNITVVGDDDQAIYRWRGAAISNIIQFRKEFKTAKIVTLTKNYRSTQEILDKSYSMIQQNNPDRLEARENINKKLTSERSLKGSAIEFFFADRVEDEAEFVVSKIKDLVDEKHIQFKNIAILVRANDHSQPFTRSLSRQKIPYQFLGPGQLFNQEEIKDLIAYLKVLYNFEDTVSLYRVLTMPIFDFEARDIAALLNFAKRKNLFLFEVLEQADAKDLFVNDEFRKKVKKILDMIKRHLSLIKKETAGQILYYFLQDSGLLKNMLIIDETTSQNIAKFFEKLKTYEVERKDASVFAVVDWIDLSMLLGESPLATNTDWSENNAVNILTIHSSKGLEFNSVFLVNLIVGRFPTRERKEQIPIPQELIKEILPQGDYHTEEERRLFYVGMTRARDNLFLTGANFYGEGKRERKISPFVFETLGENAVNKILAKNKSSETLTQLSLLNWATKEGDKPQSTIHHMPYAISYVSYSQIQTFDICPLHYKLRYILKIPTPQTAAQSFGTSVHATLRDFYQKVIRDEKVSTKDIPTLLENVWITQGYGSKTHEKEALAKAKATVTNYIEKNFDKKTPTKPIGLELPFMFSLRDTSLPAGRIKIGGRIDRIDSIGKDRIEIIDYKTGNNIPTEKKLAEDLQLTFYALAATEVDDAIFHKKAEDVLLSLCYVEEDKKLTTTRTGKQLQEAKTFILEKVKEIAKSDFSCSHNMLCQNCEYKMLCHV